MVLNVEIDSKHTRIHLTKQKQKKKNSKKENEKQ